MSWVRCGTCLTHLAYTKNVLYQTIMSLFCFFTVAGVLLKMAPVMALDGLTSFLHLKDVTNTCKHDSGPQLENH